MPRTAKNKESMFAQAEKEKLQDEVSKLSQEKGLVELKLRSYETEKTQLAPTLEEAQWEVSQILQPFRGFYANHHLFLIRVMGLAKVYLSGGRNTPESLQSS